MSYLEELLPEFRKGAKIRCNNWEKDKYIQKKGSLVATDNDFLCSLSVSDIFSNRWELYKNPEPEWDYVIKNKCLCWFWDNDEEVMNVMSVEEKFRAFGWNVLKINGHSFEQIKAALVLAKSVKGKPTAIIAETQKGKGVSFMEDKVGWHGKAPMEEECAQAVKELGGVL